MQLGDAGHAAWESIRGGMARGSVGGSAGEAAAAARRGFGLWPFIVSLIDL